LSTLADLRPGDLYFGPIGGSAGRLVGAGQLLVAPWKHQLTWRTWWKIRHCGVVVAATPEGPLIAQAEPRGMDLAAVGTQRWTPEYVYIRPAYPLQGQADAVAELAMDMVDAKIPYAFEDYAAIFAHRLHLPVPHLDRFIAAVGPGGLPKRAICSQAVDAVLTLSGGLAGGHVFDDGRLPQDIVPAELYLRLLEMTPELIIRPGKPDVAPQARGDRRSIHADLL
jgi:hypothetical protein